MSAPVATTVAGEKYLLTGQGGITGQAPNFFAVGFVLNHAAPLADGGVQANVWIPTWQPVPATAGPNPLELEYVVPPEESGKPLSVIAYFVTAHSGQGGYTGNLAVERLASEAVAPSGNFWNRHALRPPLAPNVHTLSVTGWSITGDVEYTGTRYQNDFSGDGDHTFFEFGPVAHGRLTAISSTVPVTEGQSYDVVIAYAKRTDSIALPSVLELALINPADGGVVGTVPGGAPPGPIWEHRSFCFTATADDAAGGVAWRVFAQNNSGSAIQRVLIDFLQITQAVSCD